MTGEVADEIVGQERLRAAAVARSHGYVVLPPGGTRMVDWWGFWVHGDGFREPMSYPASMMSDRYRKLATPRSREFYEREAARTTFPGGVPIGDSRPELVWREVITWPSPGEYMPGARYEGPWTVWNPDDPDPSRIA